MSSRETFKQFRAAEMFCPKCRKATPVRERLLLVLPGQGEMHDIVCAVCGEPVGKRTDESGAAGIPSVLALGRARQGR